MSGCNLFWKIVEYYILECDWLLCHVLEFSTIFAIKKPVTFGFRILTCSRVDSSVLLRT